MSDTPPMVHDASTRRPDKLRAKGRNVLNGSVWLLLTLSVLPILVWQFVADVEPWGGLFTVETQRSLAFGLTALWASGALLLRPALRIGRILVSGALIGTVTLGGGALSLNPIAMLAAILLVIAMMARLWLFYDIRLLLMNYSQLSHSSRVNRAARLAALGASMVAVVALGIDGDTASNPNLAAVAAALVALVAHLRALLLLVRHKPIRGLLLSSVVLVCATALYVVPWTNGAGVLGLALAPSIAGALFLPRYQQAVDERIDWLEPLLREPARLFAATFAFLSLITTLILVLPVASATGESIGFMNAAFMAVSAVCVTGLATIDVSVDLSVFGRIVLILAVQIGGLGIMTFSLAAMRIFGQRMSLRFESAVAGLMTDSDRSKIFGSLKVILLYTFGVEAVGALSLAYVFWTEGHTVGWSLVRGAFTAISGFNNAGFTLTSNSLIGYSTHALVLTTLASLIVLGGLSPLIVYVIPRLWRRRRLELQSKIVLVTTAILIVVGWTMFLAIEWQYTLRHLEPIDKVANALFHSITSRTAGFASVDLTDVHPATVMLTMILMVIGGSPGGVAGGIKTTTAAVLVLAVIAAIRGQKRITVGSRRITHRSVYRATATASVMVAAIVGFSMLMMLTQSISPRQSVFEVISALSTTGLSLNATPLLDEVGRSIIIGCMFIGRVGTLTLFMFLSSRASYDPWQLAKEDIEVG